jgi:hypothetical protein
VWDIGVHEKVARYFHEVAQYELNTSSGEQDYLLLLPPSGHTVRLGSTGRKFTVAIFHQLKCLDIIRQEFVHLESIQADTTTYNSPLVHHCVNYLTQTILCQADAYLEPVSERYSLTQATSDWEMDHVCTDWEAIYKAAERNSLRMS